MPMRTLLKILLLFTSLSLVPTGSANAARISLDVGPLGIAVDMHDRLLVSLGIFGERRALSPPWESKQVTPTAYHIRMPGTTDRYLKVDLQDKKVLEVINGTFGMPGGIEKPIANAIIQSPARDPSGNEYRFQCGLFPGTLVYDTGSRELSVQFAGYQIMGNAELEVIEPEEGIIHIRVRGAQNPKSRDERFWKIDIARKLLKLVIGSFGKQGGREIMIAQKISVEDPRAASLPKPAIHEDLGMIGVKKELLQESPWFAAEKDLFLDVLRQQRYDLLIVPVEVQDNAFDHIERKLMTRELVRAAGTAPGLAIPDPDLIERALGWNSRTYSDQSVYALANMLGVRTLVRIYAGHNRDMKMRLTIVRQDRPGNSGFDTAVRRTETVFADMPFSDERLPSDAFFDRLPQVLPAIGIIAPKRTAAGDKDNDLRKVPVPPSPLDLVRDTDRTPLVNAAYLSLLGALSPPDSRTSNRFFERALTLLRTRPRSADASFLRAYALGNLYRRPAALEALSKPSSPEQAALRSYLDGNLTTLPAEAEKIKAPLPKLLMQIALNDLQWRYDQQSARAGLSEIVRELPAAWVMFGERRLAVSDVWKVPPTTDLKKYLDEAIPVNGYSLQDILRSMAVRGELGAEDVSAVAASVHEHRKRALNGSAADLAPAPGGGPSRADILELAAAWAESGMLKHAHLRARTQGLYEDAIALVDRYETFFRGHPELLSYKASALWSLSSQKQGDERKNLARMANEISRDVCLWSGGQVPSCTNTMLYFENDFPRRPFWGVPRDHSIYGDRAAYELREVVVSSPFPTVPFFAEQLRAALQHRELAFRYEILNARMLEHYHEVFIRGNMLPEAEMLLERNPHRFSGSPLKAAFLARQLARKGDERAVVKLYEDTVRTVPGVWEPYLELGTVHLRNGDSGNAAATFRRYPFFSGSGTAGEDEVADTVVLSNDAYQAGWTLHSAGEVAEARKFFELSARYDTGSARCMLSAYHLALYDGDLETAGQTALALGRRYGRKDNFGDYLHILHVTTGAPETDSLFFSLDLIDAAPVPWTPVITALRMAEKSDEEIRTWLKVKGRNVIGRSPARRFFVTAFLEDRRAAAELSGMIENIEKQVELSEDQRAPRRTVDRNRQPVLSIPALYAAVRYAIEQKRYEESLTLLQQWTDVMRSSEESKSPFLEPYVTWARLKSGDRRSAERSLERFRTERGSVFEYWVGKAMLDAAAGKHGDALRSLDLARYNVDTSQHETRPISAWYQLVEACEMIFDETGHAGYRDKAIELARMHQRMAPLVSWSYAVEAKYATPGEDRLRPLGIALYLDPRSMHLAGIPEQEKADARMWMKKNDPFGGKKRPLKNQAKAPGRAVVIAGMR